MSLGIYSHTDSRHHTLCHASFYVVESITLRLFVFDKSLYVLLPLDIRMGMQKSADTSTCIEKRQRPKWTHDKRTNEWMNELLLLPLPLGLCDVLLSWRKFASPLWYDIQNRPETRSYTQHSARTSRVYEVYISINYIYVVGNILGNALSTAARFVGDDIKWIRTYNKLCIHMIDDGHHHQHHGWPPSIQADRWAQVWRMTIKIIEVSRSVILSSNNKINGRDKAAITSTRVY